MLSDSGTANAHGQHFLYGAPRNKTLQKVHTRKENTFYMVIHATKHFKRCTHEKTTLSIWCSTQQNASKGAHTKRQHFLYGDPEVQPSLPGTLETSAAPEV